MKLLRRADELLVDIGVAENVKKALGLILAGNVLADEKPVKHAGDKYPISTTFRLKDSCRFVSRAGLKLEAALNFFNLKPTDKICMDIGASTGGFTDCLLQSGAKKVYAVDVGKNLLDLKIKNDPRVISVEEANFRYLSTHNLNEKIEFVTIDVSFISILKILSNLGQFTSSTTDIVAMIKPQFEAPAHFLIKGVLRDEKLRKQVIEEVKKSISAQKFHILNDFDSPVKGPKGNIEHFVHIKPVL